MARNSKWPNLVQNGLPWQQYLPNTKINFKIMLHDQFEEKPKSLDQEIILLMQIFARSIPLWGQEVITRSNFGSLTQQNIAFKPPRRNGMFFFTNGRCYLEQSFSFRTTAYCCFHEEDKVLMVEIQLMLTLTLTLIQTKINSKRRN